LILTLLVCRGQTVSSTGALLSPKVESLTQKVIFGKNSEEEKAKSIYEWITNNIKYDVSIYNQHKRKSQIVSDVLKRKKATCEGFAHLFHDMCIAADIKAHTIKGYAKDILFRYGDTFHISNHTWNAVKIDNNWYLVDVTYGSGAIQRKERQFRENLLKTCPNGTPFRKTNISLEYVRNKYRFINQPNLDYFKANPEKLIRTHLPINPMWQLIKVPVSIQGFEADTSNLLLDSIDTYTDNYKFKDSIRLFFEKTKRKQLWYEGDRAYRFNNRNKLAKAQGNYSFSQILWNTEKDARHPNLKSKQEALKKIAIHIDSADYYFEKAGQMNDKIHSDKKGINKKRNTTTIQKNKVYLSKNYKFLDKNEAIVHNTKYKNKELKETIDSYENYYEILSNTHIYDVNHNKKHPTVEREEKIEINNQEVTQNTFEISEHQIIMDSLIAEHNRRKDQIIDTNNRQNARYTQANSGLINNNYLLSKAYDDNTNRQKIRQQKQQIALNKMKIDTIIEINRIEKRKVAKQMQKTIKGNYNVVKRFVKKNQSRIKRNKKYNKIDEKEDQRYLKQTQLLMTQVDQMIQFNKKHLSENLEDKKAAESLVNKLYEENAWMYSENVIESKRYNAFVAEENFRYEDEKKHLSPLAADTKRIKSEVKKQLRKVTKQIEKDEAKRKKQ